MADDIERRLGAAFDAQARGAVRDDAPIPTPRFLADVPHRRRWLAPLAAAAAVLAIVGSVLGLQATSGRGHHQAAAGRTSSPVAVPPPAVRMKLASVSGSFGVGMPVIAYFGARFASAKPLADATSVTVNGKQVRAAWYFERSAERGYPVEGHLRMRTYWPAHSDVRVTITANAVTPAAAMTFRTGARTIAVVDDAKHEMVVTRDGKPLGVYRVSLGSPRTPTMSGTKVIMAKKPSVCLHDVAGTYYECGVKMAQQLTYSGEYLHAAPWNTANIKAGIDTSNGCTNLLPGDAHQLYKVLEVGDVVRYPDATGPVMSPSAGYGDWNVPWSVWVRGGLIPD